jgi:uncharacterized protein (DUF2062 family)
MRRFRVVLRRWVRRLLHLHDTPHSVALGVSIGAFLGYGPLYGLHTVLAILLSAILRGNKAAALVMTWTNNPLTTVPILYAQYWLGTLLVPGTSGDGSWRRLAKLGDAIEQISILHLGESWQRLWKAVSGEILWPTLVGSVVSSIALALLVYPLARRAVVWRKHRVELRRAKRHQRLAEEHQHH